MAGERHILLHSYNTQGTFIMKNFFHLTQALVLLEFTTSLQVAHRKAFDRRITSCCRSQESKSNRLYALGVDDDDFDNILPETAFGAEAVPEGQRPINEYLDLQRAPLFGWAALDNQGLFIRLCLVYALAFGVVCYPIAGASFTQQGYLLQKIASSNVGALSIIILLLIRFYSGWGYVGQRLSSNSIEYEETGWYDGNVERKTKNEEMRDRMVYKSEVQPVLDRLKAFSIVTAGIWVASIIGFNVAMSAKPIFNEYEPDMLEKLRYDDKLAETAAASSAGRPTYCDSRYYRAVAGGSGCK